MVIRKSDGWIELTFLGGERQFVRSFLLLKPPNSNILLVCGINVAANDAKDFPILMFPNLILLN